MSALHVEDPNNQNYLSENLLVPGQCPLSLRFPRALEQQWAAQRSITERLADRSAAWTYAAMVAPGLISMVLAATVAPDQWNTSIEECATYTATTTAVLLAHLLCLVLLRPATYILVRGPFITTVRCLYVACSVLNGLQQCSTVSKWVDGVKTESPFSALLWRTGIIAMLWHGAAFRLPFKEHLMAQSFAAMAYGIFLAEDVCESLPTVKNGDTIVLAAHRILQMIWSVCDFSTFIVSGNEAMLQGTTVPVSGGAMTGSAAVAAQAVSGRGPAVQDICVPTVRCWQVIIGLLLLSSILYCREAAARRRWWWKHYGLPARTQQERRRQQQEQEQQQQTWQQEQEPQQQGQASQLHPGGDQADSACP